MESLEYCKVISIADIGEGIRVCIDFVDVLEANEGVFVGNTGHGFFLILSENAKSATYPSRPFRVNAGSFHQYLLLENNETCYLSEIKAGIKIPVFSKNVQRLVPIGRVKIERRQFCRIECESNDKVFSVTLQKSDSVRLLLKDRISDVLSLQINDFVAVLPDQAGRHLGKYTSEYIDEK